MARAGKPSELEKQGEVVKIGSNVLKMSWIQGLQMGQIGARIGHVPAKKRAPMI